MTSLCNANCNCENVKYSPVCHEATMTTFFSACHAGCTKTLSDMEFGSCDCVDEVDLGLSNSKDIYSVVGNEAWRSVRSGLCTIDCEKAFLLFAIIMCIMHGLGSSGRIGNVLVNYRCIAVEDKSFVMGTALMLISMFALIPGPIIYGAIIDSTCLIWDKTCGTTGNCWVYDKVAFRYFVSITAVAFMFFSVIFDLVVCYLGKSLELYPDEAETDGIHDYVQNEFANIPNNSKRKNSFEKINNVLFQAEQELKSRRKEENRMADIDLKNDGNVY